MTFFFHPLLLALLITAVIFTYKFLPRNTITMPTEEAPKGDQSDSAAAKPKQLQKTVRRREPVVTAPLPLDPGVPHPVYTFFWLNPTSSYACLVLEFIRESDAIAFELAAGPDCEWNTEPSLTTKQVFVTIPASFHSAHWSPLPNHRMRYAFRKVTDADKLNENILSIGTRSLWTLEGLGVFYCVDV